MTARDVLALSEETNRLMVLGNVGDMVVLGGQGWTASGVTSVDDWTATSSFVFGSAAIGIVFLLKLEILE